MIWKFKKNKTQKKYLAFSILLATAFFIVSFPAQAAITKEISYQGKLTNASNVAVADGSYAMIVSLYSAATGGTPVWTARGTVGVPTAKSVTLANGIFSTMLGETDDNPITLDFNSAYYLGVSVGGDAEMTPRKKVGAVGYAFNADRLDGLDSATSGADAHILATNAAGDLAVSGNVGIGTTGPTHKLHVEGSIISRATTPALGLYTDSVSGTEDGFDFVSGANLSMREVVAGTATTRLYIQQNGNVGIGTTGPVSLLDVHSGSDSVDSVLTVSSGTSAVTTAKSAIDLVEYGLGSYNYGFRIAYDGSNASPNLLRIMSNTGGVFADVLTIKRADGNVGIGTTNPGQKLDIYSGHIQLSDGYQLGWGANNGIYGNDATDSLYLQTGGTSRVFIKSDGNVGIGTTSPGQALDVRTPNAVGNDVQLRLGSIGGNVYDIGRVAASGFLTIQGSQAGYNSIVLAPTSGNVGIGTTSPGAKLDVSDTGVLQLSRNDTSVLLGESLGQLQWYSNDTSGGAAGVWSSIDTVSNGDLGSDTLIGTDLVFRTGSYSAKNNEKVRITSTGNVGIGTVSPFAKIHAVGDASTPVGNFYSPTDGYGATFGRRSDSGTGNAVNIAANSATGYGIIQSWQYTGGSALPLALQPDGGNVGIGTTSPGAKLDVNGAIQLATGYSAGGSIFGAKVDTYGSIVARYNSDTLLIGVPGATVAQSLAITTSTGAGIANFRGDGTTSISGNVGIGTTGPNVIFEVNKALGAGDQNVGRFLNTSGNGYLMIGTGAVGSDAIVTGYDNTNNYGFLRISGEAAGTGINIKDGGNVGIGTTSPSKMLTVGNNNQFTVSSVGAVTVSGTIGTYGNVGTFDITDLNKLRFSNADYILQNSPNDYDLSFFLGTGSPTSKVTFKSDGNVGIGTTAPSQKLDVVGNIAVSGQSSLSSDASNIFVGDLASSDGTRGLVLRAGDQDRMVINTAGNVGIGTTGPGNLLQVNSGATPATSQMRFTANALGSLSMLNYAADNSSIGFDTDFVSSAWVARNASVAWLEKSGAKFHLFGSTGNSIGSAPTKTEYVTVDLSQGNVGIGTTSPQNLLTLSKSGSYSTPGMDFFPTVVGEVAYNGSRIYSKFDGENFTDARLTLASPTGNNAFVDVLSVKNGNVGIGTTGPGAKLEVLNLGGADQAYEIAKLGNNATYGLGIATNYNSATQPKVYLYNKYDANAATSIEFGFGTTYGSGQVMTLKQSGNVGIGTTSPSRKLFVNGDSGGIGAWNNDSYSGYKENFQDVTVLDKISQLNIQEWQYKAEHLASDTSRHLSPFADDFYAQFSLGGSDHTIQSLDVAGVALKGVQELNLKVNQVSSQISDQFATLNDAFHITISRENVDLPQNRDIEAPRNRDMTLTADTINLNGNVIANGQNLNSAITGITENQNKIVEQLTGQLADQTLSVDSKLQLIGASLDALTTNQIKTLKDQITAQTKDITDLQKQMADIRTNMYIERYDALWSFYQNFELGKMPLKNALENVFDGKITAQDIEALNAIKATDIEATNSLKGQNLELGANVSGTGMIEAGKTEVVVSSPSASGTAKISLTPKGSTQGKNIFVDDITEGVSFKVKIDAPAVEKDINFYWFIIK